MKKLAGTSIFLTVMIGLSSAAHFSCIPETAHEKIILSKDAQQQICAMYSNNLHGVHMPLPDNEQLNKIFNELSNERNDAVWPRDNSPGCGYYDGLGRPISEQEYQVELDYELEHGVPYPPHLRPEAGSLSLHAHSDPVCSGETIEREITQPDLCYAVTKGMGVSADSLPANCEVMGFSDESCEGEPIEVVPFGTAEAGCYAPTTDVTRTFRSVLVECEPLYY